MLKLYVKNANALALIQLAVAFAIGGLTAIHKITPEVGNSISAVLFGSAAVAAKVAPAPVAAQDIHDGVR